MVSEYVFAQGGGNQIAESLRRRRGKFAPPEQGILIGIHPAGLFREISQGSLPDDLVFLCQKVGHQIVSRPLGLPGAEQVSHHALQCPGQQVLLGSAANDLHQGLVLEKVGGGQGLAGER